jgi:benzoyl-CoA 2,3-dioxygenase component B
VWNEVPGEYRSTLRRIIVTQGDTEPASVEQQRQLGQVVPLALRPAQPLPGQRRRGPPPLGDGVPAPRALRPRRTRRGRGLLERRSGDPDKPRILGAFNEKTPDWLSFFLFTFLTDRDGKYQLAALAESGFDPLARSTRFMLTEEAHHLFVGESGIARILQRTAEVMRERRTDDPAKPCAARA